MFYVYEYYKVENDEVFYIGKGTGRRIRELRNRNEYFKAIYNKYECAVRIVKNNLSNEEACKLERQLIAKSWKKGEAYCNLAEGGQGFSSGLLNPSKLYPEKYLGDKNGFYGRKHSDETKQKISASRKGKGARFGEDNPMYGKGFKGEQNPMYGRRGTKHHNSKSYLIEYVDGTSETLHAKGCELKFGIAFTRIRNTGGVLSYKKRTPNVIYEGALVTLIEPVTTIAEASTPKWVETGSTER